MGRNSYFSLKCGVKSIFGIDNDDKSVNVAIENLKSFENATIQKMSIYDIDIKNKFDIVFSIGVIHHLENPKKGIENLVKILKPGGTILIWVYSYEGNEWIKKFLSPIREKITSKLPISILHLLSYIISFPLVIRVKYFPTNNLYLKQISNFSLNHINSIVFDQLLPKIAHYWTKEEASSLLNQVDLADITIHRPPNEMGWTVMGRKK